MSAGRSSPETVQLVADVRRFGLLTAAAVVDRYARMVDRAVVVDGAGMAPPPDGDGPGTAGLVDGAVRMSQAYLRFLDTVAELAATRAGRADGTPRVDQVVLPAAEPGTRSEAPLWVHNPTSESSEAIEVTVTALAGPPGCGIPATAVAVIPSRIERLEAASSRELRVSVDVPGGQPSGFYHGLVLISAAPADPVVLALEVGGKVIRG